MRGKKQYTTDEVIGAIRKAQGFLSVTARLLGCSRQTVDNYVRCYPAVAEAATNARNTRAAAIEKRRQYGNNLVFSTTFRVSDELRAQLRTLAQQRGQSQAETVRDAVRMLANQQQDRQVEV